MPLDLKALNGTTWLCDPKHLQMAVARVLSVPTCPTARDIAKDRRRRLDTAKQAPERAIASQRSEQPTADEIEADQRAGTSKPLRGIKGKVGVIPMLGPLEQRTSSELMKAGGTSVEEIGVAFDALLADPSIEAIVFDVDSPGGSVNGIQELADKIAGARGRKKLYASVNSLSASAAYWLSSAAEQIMITPGGLAGSVGVYLLHMDESKALEAEGVTVTAVHAGKHKVEGNPWEPLSADARDYWQTQVDATYQAFTGALAKNRNVSIGDVRQKFGQGRLLMAEDAVAAGMADRVMSFESLLQRLVGGVSVGGAKAANVQQLRRRVEHMRAREAV